MASASTSLSSRPTTALHIRCPRSTRIATRLDQGKARAQFTSFAPSKICRLRSEKKHQTLVTVCAQVTSTPKIMISGAPASGKGTQCAKIIDKFGLSHICVGDILRAEVAEGTDAGRRAKSFMDNGELVPNEVVVDMVKAALNKAESGWLLDGYPRSADQAEAIEKENIRPDVFLLLEVPDEELVARVVGRRLDPETGEIYHMKYKPPPAEIVDRLTQRSDDTEEKMKTRLSTYHSNLGAIVDTYKDVIVKIDGNRSMEEVYTSIEEAFKNNNLI